MSDLQCAARFVVLDADTLRDLGALDNTDGLVERLCSERIAGLYAADELAGSGAVRRLAQGLGLRIEPAPGDLAFGGEGYEELADRHRGETVVLVRPGRAGLPTPHPTLHPTLLLVDADGWSAQEF